jgi:hypothetical protein
MHENHAVLGEPDGSILFGKANQIPKVGGFRVVNYAHVSLPLGVLPWWRHVWMRVALFPNRFAW